MFDFFNFEMAYKNILDHPPLEKIMGASHYTYNLLKMPGPSRVIAIHSCTELGLKCDKQSLDLAGRIGDLDLGNASQVPKEEPSVSKMKNLGKGINKT